MDKPMKLRSSLLVAALATVTATAFATHESYNALTNTDGVIVAENTTAETYLAPNEAIVEAPAPSQDVVPVVERSVQPPVMIEERRLTLDERIQGNVMDAIYNAPNISGKIGVESRDAVVTLTGYTMTGGQAWRAARAAGGVEGVRYVNNELRAKVGGGSI